MKTTLSVVCPLFNEEGAIPSLFDRLLPNLRKTGLDFEVICVNDGSQDGTLDRLLTYCERETSIHVVDLSRNFGKEAALTAGIEYATGDAIIVIDADLQDPPELISDMVRLWQAGAEVVVAKRKSRDSDAFLSVENRKPPFCVSPAQLS